MRHPSLARRILGAVALVALLATGAVADYSLFYCRTAGTTQLDCCCKNVAALTSNLPTTIVAADCCDLHAVHVDRAPTTTRRSADSLLLVSPLFTSFGTVIVEAPVARLAHAPSTGAPGIGPPLIVLKQSFLI